MSREMKESGVNWINEIPMDWSVNRIKFIFTNGKGLPITKDNLVDEGLSVVSYGQIHSKSNTGVDIKPDLIRYVNNEYKKYYPQCEVFEGDFIFADTSEDYEGCGNCVYKRDNNELYAGYHSIILHSINSLDNRYYAYLFKTDAWRKQLREIASGVKLFSISQKNLMNASVIIPHVSEQCCIANFLDSKCSQIDEISKKIQEEIDTLEEYKKSVITEAVTKGLDPSVEMKDSGIEWVGETPITWAVQPIKYLFNILSGSTPHMDNAIRFQNVRLYCDIWTSEYNATRGKILFNNKNS